MKRACERLWIKVPGLGHRTRLTARPEGPSYRTVIPRPTVKWEYSALTTEKGQQDMMPTTWAGTGTEPDHRYTDWHTTRAHGAAARDGHTLIWQPSCSDRPTSPEPRADNTHSLMPAEPERRCVKASILHMESPSHWRKDTKFDKWKHNTKLYSTHKTGDQQSQPEWSRAVHKSVKCMPSAKAGSHSYRTGTRVRAAR